MYLGPEIDLEVHCCRGEEGVYTSEVAGKISPKVNMGKEFVTLHKSVCASSVSALIKYEMRVTW